MRRLAALIAVVATIALIGCSGSSGPHKVASVLAPAKRTAAQAATLPISISAQDEAMLRRVEAACETFFNDSEPDSKRLMQLERELADAPFTAEDTITLPGVWAVGDPVSLKPPKGNARRPDALEPDDTPAQAVVLHMGSSQTRTTSGRDPKDWTDWTALTNDEGPGFYYVLASDHIQHATHGGADGEYFRRGTPFSSPNALPLFDVLYGAAPAREGTSTGKLPWVEIRAQGATDIIYRISHTASLPANFVGENTSREAAEGFMWGYWSLIGYSHATGLRVGPRQAEAFGRDLVVKQSKYGQSPQATASGTLWWMFVLPVRSDPTLFRYFFWAPGKPRPTVLWVRTAKRGGRWVVVGVGRDASWYTRRYSAAFEVYRRLGYRLLARFGSRKPAIYLYPSREQSVTVHVDYRGVLTSTSPAIDSATKGWTVRAKPDGTLTDASGRRWPYLFWEGMGAPEWDLTTGSVIRGSDADAYLRHVLAERGLNSTESREFREYWVPILSASPWVLVHWEGATYERHAPLSVTPRPDTSLRVFMVAKPLAAPIAVAPQRLAPPPKRRGFTLVEWGGALAP